VREVGALQNRIIDEYTLSKTGLPAHVLVNERLNMYTFAGRIEDLSYDSLVRPIYSTKYDTTEPITLNQAQVRSENNFMNQFSSTEMMYLFADGYEGRVTISEFEDTRSIDFSMNQLAYELPLIEMRIWMENLDLEGIPAVDHLWNKLNQLLVSLQDANNHTKHIQDIEDILSNFEIEKSILHFHLLVLTMRLQVHQNKFQDALDVFTISEKLYAQLKDEEQKFIANIRAFSVDYPKTVLWKDETILRDFAYLLNLGGVISEFSGAYTKAIEYYSRALELRKELVNSYIGNEKDIATTTLNIGNYYFRFRDFNTALEYYQEARRIYQQFSSYSSVLRCYLNLGFCHQNLGEFDNAISYANKVLEEHTGEEYSVDRARAFELQADSYRFKGDFSNAEKNYLKSLAEFTLEDNFNLYTRIIFSLLLIYLDRDDKEQAKHYLKILEESKSYRANEFIGTMYQIAHTKYQSSVNKSYEESLQTFLDILKSDTPLIDFRIYAALNVADILIDQIKTDTKPSHQIDEILTQLKSMAKTYQIHTLQISNKVLEYYWELSKTGDHNLDSLTEAKILAIEFKLTELEQEVDALFKIAEMNTEINPLVEMKSLLFADITTRKFILEIVS
jgi:tetratricopeptide (TPR) repeat protein